MKASEVEQSRKDIAEAFDFTRFLIKNPAALKRVRNGSHIRIVPQTAARPRPSRYSDKVQTFEAETIFHSL